MTYMLETKMKSDCQRDRYETKLLRLL